MRAFACVAVLLFTVGFVIADFVPPPMKWNWMNFTWQSPGAYAQWLSAGGNENVMLAGVKVNSQGDIFISFPRWRPLVPATVCVIRNGTLYLNASYFSKNIAPAAPLVDPFPSWADNEVGNPDALQSVLGFEIDPLDRIWILDQGKVEGQDAIPNSIKLSIFNSVTGELLQTYRFPESQASLSNSFLNDVVVDHRLNVAYISDSGIPSASTSASQFMGGLLIYDYATNSSRRVLSAITPTQPDLTLNFSINGEPVLHSGPMRTGADGIALSNDGRRLYWCPLTSHTIYAISTSSLLNETLTELDLEGDVVILGSKGWYELLVSASDGLAADNTDRIFFGSLEGSAVMQGHITGQEDTTTAMKLGVRKNDSTLLHWPDTFGFDHRGSLLVVANQLNRFLDNELNFSEPNFRIWRIFVDGDSYMAHSMVSGEKLLKTEIIVGSSIAGVVLLVFAVVLVIRCCSDEGEIRYQPLPEA